MCRGYRLKANLIDDFISELQIEEFNLLDLTDEEAQKLEQAIHD